MSQHRHHEQMLPWFNSCYFQPSPRTHALFLVFLPPSKLTREDGGPCARRPASPRSRSPRLSRRRTIPSGGRTKKQLKVSNRLSTCHGKQKLNIKKVPVLLSLQETLIHQAVLIQTDFSCCTNVTKRHRKPDPIEEPTRVWVCFQRNPKVPESTRCRAGPGGPDRIQVARSADSRRN